MLATSSTDQKMTHPRKCWNGELHLVTKVKLKEAEVTLVTSVVTERGKKKRVDEIKDYQKSIYLSM